MSAAARLPSGSNDQNYVSVHALSAGFFTLPENRFVSPISETSRRTVPSLSFLIQHQNATNSNEKPTRFVFDLGLRRIPTNYIGAIREHVKSRQPMTTEPDVTASLAKGGLKPEDVDYVILSHVHWDHIGTPTDFPTSKFVVGNGSLDLLKSGADPSAKGAHAHFEPDLLPPDRTLELPNPDQPISTVSNANGANGTNDTNDASATHARWQNLGLFPKVIDVCRDGSLYIVDAPGHLQGHINILARTGPNKWVYLAGDACHDRRLLRKELAIAEWEDEHGRICCIHHDKRQVEKTLEKIREMEIVEGDKVEVIIAHDWEWVERKSNLERFWPGKL